MRENDRIAALENAVREFEKCRGELGALHERLRTATSGEPIDDIVELAAEALASANRSVQVAYARLEREHTRSSRPAVRDPYPLPAGRLGVA